MYYCVPGPSLMKSLIYIKKMDILNLVTLLHSCLQCVRKKKRIFFLKIPLSLDKFLNIFICCYFENLK